MADRHISQAAAQRQTDEDVVKPPIPRWMYKIVNPTMAAILRSPFHRLLSNNLMLLSFKGHKSGKRYTIPVGYQQKGDRLYVFSHAGWWKNLLGTAVAVRLRGKTMRGTARRLEDRQQIAELVRTMVAQRGEKMAARMGLMEYADPHRSGPLPQRTKFFEIQLDEPPT